MNLIWGTRDGDFETLTSASHLRAPLRRTDGMGTCDNPRASGQRQEALATGLRSLASE